MKPTTNLHKASTFETIRNWSLVIVIFWILIWQVVVIYQTEDFPPESSVDSTVTKYQTIDGVIYIVPKGSVIDANQPINPSDLYSIDSFTGPFCRGADDYGRSQSDRTWEVKCVWRNVKRGEYKGQYVTITFAKTVNTDYTLAKGWEVTRIYVSSGIKQ